MMHSFEGLADEISTLLKNAGDTGDIGDIGDMDRNVRHINRLSVTKTRNEVSPNENTLVTLAANFGDAKSKENQLIGEGVTNVTSVTKNFEGSRSGASGDDRAAPSHAPDAGQIIRFPTPPAGIPQEWLAGLQRLDAMPPSAAFTDERWAQLLADAHGFIDRWGRAAAQFGWSTLDLFGVHPLAPITRYDAKGLISLLGGNSVVAVSEHTATIRMPSGSTLRFNRRSKTAGVCIWEIR